MPDIRWTSGERFPPGLAFEPRDPGQEAWAVITEIANGVRVEMENVAVVSINPVDVGALAGYSREQVMQILTSLSSFLGRFDINLAGEGKVAVHLFAPPQVPIAGFTLDGSPVEPTYVSGEGAWVFEISLSERTLSIIFPGQNQGQAMVSQTAQGLSAVATANVMMTLFRAMMRLMA